MPTPTAGRTRLSFKASHRRISLRISHRSEAQAERVERLDARERYIAPNRKRRSGS